MGSSNILTVRLPEDELVRLSRLAKLQNRTRSQVVQEAISAHINQNEEIRAQEFELMRSRLKPAIQEQCALIDRVSVADEHRRF